MFYLIKIIFRTLVYLYIIYAYSCDKAENPLIRIETPIGTISAELYPKKAPITVQNFLSYIKQNR